MQSLHDGEGLPAKDLERGRKEYARGTALAAAFDDLVKAGELEALCDLELLSHGRDLPIGQDDRFFLCEMKDDPLFFELQIAAKDFEVFEQAERKVAFILRNVGVGVEIDEDREQEEQRPEKERINKKFAHTDNMSESRLNYLFRSSYYAIMPYRLFR